MAGVTHGQRVVLVGREHLVHVHVQVLVGVVELQEVRLGAGIQNGLEVVVAHRHTPRTTEVVVARAGGVVGDVALVEEVAGGHVTASNTAHQLV